MITFWQIVWLGWLSVLITRLEPSSSILRLIPSHTAGERKGSVTVDRGQPVTQALTIRIDRHVHSGSQLHRDVPDCLLRRALNSYARLTAIPGSCPGQVSRYADGEYTKSGERNGKNHFQSASDLYASEGGVERFIVIEFATRVPTSTDRVADCV